MFVIFDDANGKDKAMLCFHKNTNEQRLMMHRLDEDEQVKEWQKTNTGNPPRFGSRIIIKGFTDRRLYFSNI